MMEGRGEGWLLVLGKQREMPGVSFWGWGKHFHPGELGTNSPAHLTVLCGEGYCKRLKWGAGVMNSGMHRRLGASP